MTAPVRVHPRLAQAALAARSDRALRAWVVLRCLDEPGRAHLDLAEARASLHKELRGHGGQRLSARSVRRVLAEGDGVLWNIDRRAGLLHLRSLETACQKMGLARRPGAPVLIALDDVRELPRFRAWCVAAQFSGENAVDRPISLDTLAVRCGRSRRSLHTYIRATGVVRIQRNVLHSIRRPVPLDAEARGAGWHYTKRRDGKPIMAKRLPNAYSLSDNVTVGPEGRGRKVRTVRQPTRDRGRGMTRVALLFLAAPFQPRKVLSALHHMAVRDYLHITETPLPLPLGASARAWGLWHKPAPGQLVRL